ncbi:metallophosphoesterase family protein [Natribaculum luteum]|uniref:Metallophosphoesterase family protein n=1 Tax=Natribaculum luteum TaxID=1586232 RepID=A0ABD5P067_9EURY|nr:metallophosphoesterase [Natribaculum luteum]
MRDLPLGDECETLLARLTTPTASETTLAVVSDPHVTPHARGSTKVFHRTVERFRSALVDADRLGADAVVCPGDLTKDGTPAEFDRATGLLEETDLPFFAVPGNHDVPKSFDDHDAPPVTSFARNYAPGDLPYHVRVGGVDLIGLDSATGSGDELVDGHSGLVTDDQLEWLDETLADAAVPVVFFHHPLVSLSARVDAFGHRTHHRLQNADALLEVLAAHDVSLALSGHVHWPLCWSSRGVRHVVAPSTCSFPQMYLRVEITPTGTDVWLQPLADWNGLTEAYRHACTGDDRGRAISECTTDGYFDSLPLRDEVSERTSTSRTAVGR